jgi:ABC-type phosphate/phosphonate transport system substrate-binding protein
MIASLPMYDWPEVRASTDAWWQAIATRLKVALPLTRRTNYSAAWRDPDLLFSQTCGYPLTHAFRGLLRLVAVPHYAADGCGPGTYCSLVLARRKQPLEAFRGTVAAVNGPDSMSGMLALKLVFAPLAERGRFFGRAVESGGHLASMAAVREGRADICAIDAVCYAMARRYRPGDLEGLVEVTRSPAVPALPYVTVSGDVEALRAALADAFDDRALAGVRDSLLLESFSTPDISMYYRITDLETAMQNVGGLALL